MSTIWLSCKMASLLTSQSLDRKLSWREQIMRRLHVAVCEACTQLERQVVFIRLAVREGAEQIDNEHLGGLSDGARLRIRQSLQRQ